MTSDRSEKCLVAHKIPFQTELRYRRKHPLILDRPRFINLNLRKEIDFAALKVFCAASYCIFYIWPLLMIVVAEAQPSSKHAYVTRIALPEMPPR